MKLSALLFWPHTCWTVILSSLIFSPSAMAIGQYIKQQNPAMLSTSTYILAGIMLGLFLIVVVQSMLKSKQANKSKQVLDKHQALIDDLASGVLHVDLDGKIQYINHKGAALLGRDREKLINSVFNECFKDCYLDSLNASFSQSDSSTNVQAKASNLYLMVNFGDTVTTHKKPFRVLTLNDQHQVQKQLNQCSSELHYQQHLLQGMQYARLCIDLQDNSFIHDGKFDNLLLLQNINDMNDASAQSAAIDLQDLEDRLHNADLSQWKNAIHACSEKGFADIQCRIQLATKGNSKVYIAIMARMVGVQKHSPTEDESAPTHIEVFIHENTEHEKQKQHIDNLKLEQQTLLSTTPGAAYALDDSGNIVWANSNFNQLLRQLAPDTKSRNLLNMDVLPDDIKRLHERPPGASSRSYNMEFEATMPDGTLLWMKLNLSFYLAKDRLSEQSNIGMVGVLQDVTELTQTRRELEQERAQMAKILDLAPVAIATIDADDRILSANNVMTERLNFTDKELKKQGFYQLFSDPSEAGKAAKHLNSSGRLRDFHAKLKGKDNKLHPSELHVDLVNKDKQEYLCWIADRSDEQFQQDKFESLLEHSSMPMAILSENGFSKANQAACDFFCVEDEFDLFGISPYSSKLNTGGESAKQLEQTIDDVKRSGKAKSMHWEHKVGDQTLPCHASYVPMYKDQAFDSILCIWNDKRELQKADEARMQAINLHQAAEREIAEKQKLLANSQDQLANKTRTLADTQTQLQSVQENLSETQSEYTHLQQAHKSVTDNLAQLKEQYSHSRVMLADAQQANAELNTQLESSSERVKGLMGQREQIAHALKKSESKYKAAQNELAISEQNAEKLKHEQQDQSNKMHALVDQINAMKQAVNDKDSQISQVSDQISTLQSQLNSSSSVTEKLREQLVNQRKASEQAEVQRRELEQTCQLAQSDLRNKTRHLHHLQSEMEKLEEMSNQEKGDMQAQQSALKQELENKLAQLEETQSALSEAKEAAEQEKREKAAQQAKLEAMQAELIEAEEKAHKQQQEMEAKEKEQREAQKQVQQKLWQELKDKQLKLQQTEQILSQTKQQTESEKAEKEKQRQLFEQLKTELQEIEQRNAQQAEKMAQSDAEIQRNKETLASEVEAKREQLEKTKHALDEIKRQADQERLARIEQEQKLQQLTVELSDVETRANKQKEMLAGSDEQWRKHHAEIEQQKQALQQALAQAKEQNVHLQGKLENKLGALQEAESKVDKTQSGEKELQKELDSARTQAQELQSKIAQQEQKEIQLQHQLGEQQQVLEAKESSISELENKQLALQQELASVQQEYASSKESLSQQHSSHNSLNSQMSELEQALQQSKEQLANKESALQAAQAELESSQSKLTEQENALLKAHKQELQEATAQASQQSGKSSLARPEIEKLPLPDKPAVWFDLLPYLQSQPQIESLPIALTELMDELEESINNTEQALEENDTRTILTSAKKLVRIANKINSDALSYQMQSIENDCANGMIDNVSIRWPATKQGLQKTLRVVYSHLQA